MEPLPTYRIVLPIVAMAVLCVVCWVRKIPRFQAMLLGIGIMSAFGMILDQISVRLCPEYFTALHSPIVGLTEPTLLGMAWGFLGSWWGGALWGYLAGVIATSETQFPPFTVRNLIRPMLVTISFVAIVTTITGLTVWRHAEMFEIHFVGWLTTAVPVERQKNAFIVACYHFSAYISAIVGGMTMCVWLGWKRRQQPNTYPRT
jgi:hypothetical protein